MKILLIHQAFNLLDQAGGTRHYELGRRLADQGHLFSVVTSDLCYLTGQRSVDAKGLITEQHVDGIRVLRTYTYPTLHRSFVWRIISFLSFMFTSIYAGLKAGPVDIVIGTTPPIFQAASACLIALLRRRPFLLEVRDLWPEFAIDMGVLKNPLLIFASRALERFLYTCATRILVNSPAYSDYLIDRGVPLCKISLIPNGVEPEMFNPDNTGQWVREAWQIENRYVVTYAGAMGMANDIPTVLRAASMLSDDPQVHFLMVGDGKERRRLEDLAKELQLSNVTFIGPRPKNEMCDILAASDVCLATLKDIPMFATTYPNKVFDYMAAGRPTILGIDGVIRLVVEAGDGGIFVPPGNSEALAAAVRTLSTDRQRGREMGKSARAYVIQHFNRKAQAEQLEYLLQEMSRK